MGSASTVTRGTVRRRVDLRSGEVRVGAQLLEGSAERGVQTGAVAAARVPSDEARALGNLAYSSQATPFDSM
jgi:hypothetical protein